MNNEKANTMKQNGTSNGQEACPLDAIVNPPCNEVFLMDCMQGMKQYPDKFFDIAIVDPPYGYGTKKTGILNFRMEAKEKEWNTAPTLEYFYILVFLFLY